ncbi:MAG: ACT domain-containing protein [Saccharofermentans sp.]|jgi:chorismate mutase|nr:ACT domain-containing protein [Oscillospiraceae bacterium]MBO4449831.1 ACT domain-containing protein [Clostridiales bacterium]MCR4776979.1 ACT domain-containing protein [Saccharofermentans sp.]MBR1906913.1 ACT domain-containing protein [Clostridiales bacterium]MBR3463506.1 ACT domain-containing protein [Clostridiales bacterium]
MEQDIPEYYLVDRRVLPEVFIKVMEVKQRLNTGESVSVNEAVRKTGLSRSAYYKYKDSVMPFYEATSGKKVTLLITVENFQGILSSIITIIADSHANILTINQNIPINGLADISISIETVSMFGTVDDIMKDIAKLAGVRKCEILSRE